MRGYIRLRKLKSPDGAKSWRIVAELPRDPVTGKRRQKHKSVRGAKKDAERELRRLIAEIESGRLASSGRQTVGEYLQRWLRDYAVPNVAAKTYVRYEGIVRVHLIPALGEIPLESLKPTDIQSYYTSTTERNTISNQTIVHHHRVLKQALKHAVAWELIVRNPADGAIPPRRTRPAVQTLDVEQAFRLTKGAAAYEYEGPVVLALHTGMRQAEILGLKWADIDLIKRRVHVMQTLQRVTGSIIVKEPKSPNGRRVIPSDDRTQKMLKRQQLRQKEDQLGFGQGWQNDYGLVFTTVDGRPIDDSVLRRHFRKMLLELNLPRIRFHDLRHTHATILLILGTHPKVVSERLGHASIAITLDTYSHVLPHMQEQAAADFGNALDLESHRQSA